MPCTNHAMHQTMPCTNHAMHQSCHAPNHALHQSCLALPILECLLCARAPSTLLPAPCIPYWYPTSPAHTCMHAFPIAASALRSLKMSQAPHTHMHACPLYRCRRPAIPISIPLPLHSHACMPPQSTPAPCIPKRYSRPLAHTCMHAPHIAASALHSLLVSHYPRTSMHACPPGHCQRPASLCTSHFPILRARTPPRFPRP